MAKCREVMTKDPASCSASEMVTKVASLMKQHDVGSVPVVESDKRLVGIVTDRDIVLKVVAAGRNPEQTPVKEAMTPNPVSCKEDDDLDYALKLMKERQVRRMPIADGSGRLTGIIAQADVATRVSKDAKTGELVEAISESAKTRH
jgi:CBS domain-containing protein